MSNRTRNVVIAGVIGMGLLLCLCLLVGVVGMGGLAASSPVVRASVGEWFAQGGDPDQAAAAKQVADDNGVPSAGRSALLAEQPAPTPEVIVYTETVVFTNTVVFTETLVVTDTVASEALGAAIVAEAEEEAEAIRMGAAALLDDCEKTSQPTAWASDPDYGQEWQLGSPEETCWTLIEWRYDVCAVDPTDEPLDASEQCWGIFMLGPGEFVAMPFDTAGTIVVLGPEWSPDNRHERAQENIAVGMYARWVANGGNPGITVMTNHLPEGAEVKYVDENGVTQIVDPKKDWPESINYQDVRFLDLPVEEPVEAYP